jgi:hypothetical protein
MTGTNQITPCWSLGQAIMNNHQAERSMLQR